MRTTMATENNNKTLNVPNLRFPKFRGEWEKYRLKDIANISKERIGISMLSNNNYISTENMKSDFGGVDVATNLPASGNVLKFQQGDTLLSNIRPYLKKIWQAKFDGGCSADIFVFRSNMLCNSDFLYYTLANDKFISYAMSGAKGVKMPRGDKEQILKYELHLPTIIEQNKITSFLSLLDERIATQIKIIEDLKKLKSAITHLHFDAAIDKYYSAYIGDCIEQVSQRNKDGKVKEVLSVSNKNGFVNQSEQFEDREIASEDTSNYKVVHTNDFAYNPARINVGSVARLHNYACGIVSPMYICFHTKPMLLPEYFEHIFSTSYFRHEMHKRLEGSVRLCLTYDSLCNIKIALPSIDEQKQFVSQISAIISKIINEDRLLTLYQTLKRYLLSQMFI